VEVTQKTEGSKNTTLLYPEGEWIRTRITQGGEKGDSSGGLERVPRGNVHFKGRVKEKAHSQQRKQVGRKVKRKLTLNGCSRKEPEACVTAAYITSRESEFMNKLSSLSREKLGKYIKKS